MKGTKIGVVLGLLLIFAFSVVADPIGFDNVTGVSSERRTTASPYNISALAGNVTEMNINAISITQFWQGYYGNITGTIVLANANNETMYDWNIADATGEIYASRSSNINWSGIACADNAQLVTEEGNVGMTASTVDGINETFTTGVNSFVTGAISLSNCLEANLHDENGTKTDGLYDNVVLADTDGDIVYTSILNNDATGFDNRSHDFQLIVAENGTNANTQTTMYYFWVELA